jgi:GlcNAc-P-P-Und epimerase
VNKTVTRRRVLVTGGSGFIGTNVVAYYRELGHHVVSLDIAAPRCRDHVECWKQVDILDARALVQAFEDIRPHIVFHLAARTDLFGGKVSDYLANTVGVENVINSALRAEGLVRVVFASSMLVCRIGYVPRNELDYCPSTAYGESKVLGEQAVRRLGAGLPWMIVRPTSIWGPWFGPPYRDFFELVRKGRYVHPSGSLVQRSYGYVGNVVHQLAELANSSGAALLGRAMYVGDFEPLDIRSWADMIAREFDVAPVREVPMWVFRAAAKVGDVLKALGMDAPPMTSYRLRNMLTHAVYDFGPLQALGVRPPYTIVEGVRHTCEWMRRAP